MDGLGDAVVLLKGQRNCDSQIAGSSPGWAPLRMALAKLLTPVCFCHRAVFGTGQPDDLVDKESNRGSGGK